MDMTNLVEQLVSQLGITQQQAQGGAGLLLKVAKDQLGEANFRQVVQSIPNSAALLAQAPPPSGLGGLFGSLASSLGGQVAEVGGLTNVVSGFTALGLDQSQIAPFIATVVAFVEQKGGPQVAAFLQKGVQA